MIYDIVISDQAEIDLRGIFEYIAFELPYRASAQKLQYGNQYCPLPGEAPFSALHLPNLFQQVRFPLIS